MNFLKRHPFPVLAHFDRVVAVSFAFPAAVLQPLITNGLEIDSHGGFGFVTVALVWTRAMRPAGFPVILGNDFFLAGYRVFTRLNDSSGRRLRGLKILRSETNKRRMVCAGNLLTHYRYRHVQLRVKEADALIQVSTWRADGTPTLKLSVEVGGADPELPKGSPFPDWSTARRFAGPMPFTFSPDTGGRFLVIEGRRSSWVPRPVMVKEWQVALFDEPPFRGTHPVLANAFAVENVSYRWERGRLVTPGAIQ